MDTRVTVPGLRRMKAEGRKIVGVVAWDHQVAQVVDRAGVDIVSVGDSVGVRLWGRTSPLDVTMDEMVLVCRAVRRGVRRALVSCDFPFGPLQEGTASAVRAAVRLVRDGGADMVKLDGAASFPDAVAAIARAGIPVFAQFGLSPQTAHLSGIDVVAGGSGGGLPEEAREAMVREAQLLEKAGASILDFTNSGPVVGPAVVASVSIPVVGGVGGGPWLDGRVRMVQAAVGYDASAIDEEADRYADVARTILGAVEAYAADVREGRQIRGGLPPASPTPTARRERSGCPRR